VINIHKLDNADKALNKDMQTNNETEHVCTAYYARNIIN